MLRLLRSWLAPRESRDSAALLIARADAARDSHDWRAAARHYAAALGRNPNNAAIWVQLGNTSKEAGDHAGAQEAYRRALILRPEDPDIHLQLGHLLKRMGRHDAAAGSYEAALRRDPGSYEIYRELEVLGHARLAQDLVAQAHDGDMPPRLFIFDVSDLLFYAGHHDYLSGIQRVQCSIILAILDDGLLDPPAMQFAAFDRIEKRFLLIHRERFASLLRDLLRPREERTIPFDREQANVGRLYAIGPIERRASATSSVLILLGAAWSITAYPGAITRLRRDCGMTFAMVFHDLIPVLIEGACEDDAAIMFRSFLDEVLDEIDLALCVSENTARDLTAFCRDHGRVSPPTTVIRLGSTFGEFLQSSDRRGHLVTADQPYVLFVSTIEARKNHAFALRLWERLRAEGCDAPRLLLVGRPGWRSEEFLEHLRSAGDLRDRIELLGQVSDADLDTLYARCLFTIYPSLYEGWGLPVGESLAHGKVCVLSDRASLPEVAGEHGVYIPLDNLPAAAAIIRRLIGDPATLQRKERAIREGFRPIAWKTVARHTLDACRDLDQRTVAAAE